jgi:hypothetical protein
MTTVILQSEAKRGAGAQRLAGGVGVSPTNPFDQTGAEQTARDAKRRVCRIIVVGYR